MGDTSRPSGWLGRLAAVVEPIREASEGNLFLLSRADGPVWVLPGGPLRSGEKVELSDLDWDALDERNELEMEIVGAKSSRTLWFSVHEGIPYVACDLDAIGGRLKRWAQQIERDDRVVIRIDSKRAEARLVHVPHESEEYEIVRAGRERKYSREQGVRAAAESTAHDLVVSVGEVLTGRSKRKEPGDRLYRVAPRRQEA